LFLDTDQYIWDEAWTLQKCGSKVGEIWKLYKILKYIPFFLKNKKYTLAVIVNGDKGFFAKKNILMARGFFFKKNTLVLPMAAGVFF
jgi:hypothetical protein